MSYSKKSSFYYDDSPQCHTANEFCQPWQDQWTNAHLAHTSSPWQMCHDFDHRLDHGVARTAWPWSSKTSSADEQRRERNIKLMSKDYWNSGNRLQALNLRVTGGKRYSSGSGWSFF